MKGGYGPKAEDTLRTALRAEIKAAGRARQVRLVETGCMGRPEESGHGPEREQAGSHPDHSEAQQAALADLLSGPAE